LDGHDVTEAAVAEVFPALTTLSAKFTLLTIVGYREGAGHELISETAARKFEKQWRGDVRNATLDQLAGEVDLARVIYWARRDLASDEAPIDIPDDPRVTRALLRSARSETQSQSLERRAIRRTSVFHWSTLEDLYGDEHTLILRIEELKASDVGIDPDLSKLVDKYLGGWRPRDFGDDEDD
jgi:hypothetical protein